ncbi:MAG: DUF47 family protein [Verrucomicrobia bacterium]|nr:DUF47 family protein [Verrucomicrobiota bacterium]
MAILTTLFGESPFGMLAAHAQRVHGCVRLLRDLFRYLEANDPPGLLRVAEQIFALETEADRLRNRLHELLAAKALLPMRKEDLFQVLEQQDTLADLAEEIAGLLTCGLQPLPSELMHEVQQYLDRVLRNCELVEGILSKLELLVESSFGGRDALTVSRLITELAEREDDLKPQQIGLSRRLLAAEPPLGPVQALLWLQVIGHLAGLSKGADRTGNGIRLTLQIKSDK